MACYLCFEPAHEANTFASEPRPCSCKGSIEIHEACLQSIVDKNIHNCSICKTKYNEKYLPKRGGLPVIIGNLLSGGIIEYTVDQEGRRQGQYIMRDTNGQILVKYNYKDGKMHGPYVDFHANGEIRSTGTFINNQLEGMSMEYYEDGSIKEVAHYLNGDKHGESVTWVREGYVRVSTTQLYIHGKPQFDTAHTEEHWMNEVDIF